MSTLATTTAEYATTVTATPPHPALPVSHYILMAFAYPSAGLYLWLFVVIVRYRRSHLQSSFYDLVIIKAIADIVMLLSMELCDRPRKYRFLPIFVPQENTFFTKFAFSLSIFARNAMYIGCVPFAFNRFTMFYFPTIHKMIWEPRTILFCFLCQWAVPILANTYPFFIRPETVLSFRLLPNGVLQMYVDASTVLVNNSQNVIVGLSVIAVCSTLYMCTFRKALSLKIHSEATRIEIRHLICCFFAFIPIILEATRACAHLFGGDELHVFTTELFFYTTEVACLSQAWSVLFTNRLIRSLMFGRQEMRTREPTRVSFVQKVGSPTEQKQGQPTIHANVRSAWE